MSRNNKKWMVVGVLLLVLTVLVWWGTRGYGETSSRGYALAAALFSACNQHDLERLEKIESLIVTSARDGELGKDESAWLQSIVRLGESGNWRAATREVRRLLDAQRREAPPFPEP